jgi:hypothetical protein
MAMVHQQQINPVAVDGVVVDPKVGLAQVPKSTVP